jgi:predicted negative regulator of RcsB-dependent stress response
VQSYTRHQLKEDKFKEASLHALEAAQAHRKQITVISVIVLVIVVAAGAVFYWRTHQQDVASAAIGEAMNTYNAPIRAAGAPVTPGQLSFSSAEQRAKEAEKQFQSVADKYGSTQAGKTAAYMAAVSALDAGDYASAEPKFKALSESRHQDLASLAKLGLASVYESTNRNADAIKIYSDLMAHPTESVSRERAQFALASLYESSDPAQAKKMYEQLASDKSPGVAQIAREREAALAK